MTGKRTTIPLSVSHPELCKQWHPTKNGDLTPDDFTFGTKFKAWWLCPVAPDHVWDAAIASRASRGRGCRACDGKQVSVTNCLKILFPELSEQWHPTKNGDLTPSDFTSKSIFKAWWKCPNGPDHEWQIAISVRSSGNGCDYCRGQKLSVTNSLQTVCPDVAKEWHPSKNGDLTPADVLSGSKSKAWWKCPKGPDHDWLAQIGSRTSEERPGCPACDGKQVSVTNSLKSLFPQVAKGWHPIKNGSLNPADVVAGSNSKAWWTCPNGPDHEWRAGIGERTYAGRGCPFCSSNRVSVTNSLQTLFPQLATEWHPNKNGKLTPSDVLSKSGRKVWWYCDKGPDHSWSATISNRSANGATCPCCDNKKLSITNCLQTLFPKLSEEWHPTNNGQRTPSDVIAGSGSKAWWRCAKGHEWEMKVVWRSYTGNGCKRCARTHKRSYMEIALAFELFDFFGIGTKSTITDIDGRTYDVLDYRPDLDDRKVEVGSRNREADILLRELNLIVEYDGNHWHSDATRKVKGARFESDVKKTRSLQAEGWTVLRVREHPLELISDTDITIPSNQDPKLTANAVLQKIQEIRGMPLAGLEEYLATPTMKNQVAAEYFYRTQ